MVKLTQKQMKVLEQAAAIYGQLAKEDSDLFKEVMNKPEKVVEFLKPRFVGQEREHFDVVFLNQQHELLSCERLFSGTINQASVHPREIAKRCLELNAASVVLAHNHPSGAVNPSKADIDITKKIKESLNLFEVKVLDHIIIGSTGRWTSLAQTGDI